MRKAVWMSVFGLATQGDASAARSLLPALCQPCFAEPEPSPPSDGRSYDGIRWPTLCVDDSDGRPTHFFTIGDWGGWMSPDGPRTFDNTRHKREFVDDVDDVAQRHVAEAMKRVAKTSKPKFTINVGDNFYPGGIESTCGQKDMCSLVNTGQWQYLFEQMYDDPDLNKAPWHGVLGNHDFGGFQFNKGWDQMMAYTWHSDRWITPALYWERRVQYCDFAVDLFFVDTNRWDAFDPETNSNRNICSSLHNKDADCKAVNGPSSAADCVRWFKKLWDEQLVWLETRLNQSEAEWQIVVTHFPPQWATETWKRISKAYGIDLIIAGHRHQQEVHYQDGVVDLGSTAWVVTGGGGGATSESNPLTETPQMQQYGFMDVAISKDNLTIQMWSWQDENVKSSTSTKPVPRGGLPEDTCYRINATLLDDARATNTIVNGLELANAQISPVGLEEVPCSAKYSCEWLGCGNTDPDHACQCERSCVANGKCCKDFKTQCMPSQIIKTVTDIAEIFPFWKRPWRRPRSRQVNRGGSDGDSARRLSTCDANRRRHRGGPIDGLEEDPWEGRAPGADLTNGSWGKTFFGEIVLAGSASETAPRNEGTPIMYLEPDIFLMQTDLASDPCLASCNNQSGYCDYFCGVGRACCHQGDVTDAPECARALNFLTDHHECVGLSAGVLPSMSEPLSSDVGTFHDEEDASVVQPSHSWVWLIVLGVTLFALGLALLAADARIYDKRRRRKEYEQVQLSDVTDP